MSKKILRAEKRLERRMKEIKIHFHVEENPLELLPKPSFSYRFCPICGKMRNMIAWGICLEPNGHETFRCVECETELVYDLKGRFLGFMKAKTKNGNIVTFVPLGEGLNDAI